MSSFLLLLNSVLFTTAISLSQGAVPWSSALEEGLRNRYTSDVRHSSAASESAVVTVVHGDVEDPRLGSGTVFEVAQVRAQNGAPLRPYQLLSRPSLYFVSERTGRIETYTIPFVSSGYVVFTRLDSNGVVLRPQSIKDVVIAKLESPLDLESVYQTVAGLSNFSSPLYLTGQVLPHNDGSNAPWWNWSMGSVFVTPTAVKTQGDFWVATAVLDNMGYLLAGNFSPRELSLSGKESETVRGGGWTLTSEVQRSLANLFYSDQEARRRHEERKRRVLLNRRVRADLGPEGFTLESTRATPMRMIWAFSDTLDQARGSYAQPSYRHRLTAHFDNGQTFTLILQNNLRSLQRRPLEFRGPRFGSLSPWYPVELWLHEGNTGLPTGERRSQFPLQGSILVRELKTDTRTGAISSIDAEVTFQSPMGHGEQSLGYLNLKIDDLGRTAPLPELLDPCVNEVVAASRAPIPGVLPTSASN